MKFLNVIALILSLLIVNNSASDEIINRINRDFQEIEASREVCSKYYHASEELAEIDNFYNYEWPMVIKPAVALAMVAPNPDIQYKRLTEAEHDSYIERDEETIQKILSGYRLSHAITFILIIGVLYKMGMVLFKSQK